MRIPITIYPSYIRLSKKDTEKLFGKNYILTKQKQLPQENIFICKEKLNIKNSNLEIKNITIIGPNTKQTEIILDQIDAKNININTITLLEKNTKKAQNIFINNGTKSIYTRESTVISQIHLQISKSDAQILNLKQNQKINLKINKTNQILKDVTVKIKDSYILDLYLPQHLSKKYNIKNTDRAEIIF